MQNIIECARSLTGDYALTQESKRCPERFAYMKGLLVGRFHVTDEEACDYLHDAIEHHQDFFIGDYHARDVREVD